VPAAGPAVPGPLGWPPPGIPPGDGGRGGAAGGGALGAPNGTAGRGAAGGDDGGRGTAGGGALGAPNGTAGRGVAGDDDGGRGTAAPAPVGGAGGRGGAAGAGPGTAAGLTTGFLGAALRAGAFFFAAARATPRFAVVFRAAGLRAAGLRAAGFRAAGFFAAARTVVFFLVALPFVLAAAERPFGADLALVLADDRLVVVLAIIPPP
jgi:hypothetical protein